MCKDFLVILTLPSKILNFQFKAYYLQCNFNAQKWIVTLTLYVINLLTLFEAIFVPLYECLFFNTRFDVTSQTIGYQFIILQIFLIQLVYAALAVKIRFSLLEIFLNQIEMKLDIFEQGKLHKIEVFERLFHSLCDAIDIINKSLIFNFFIASTSYTLSYMLSTYGVVFAFLTNDKNAMGVFIRDGLWGILQFMMLAIAAYTGSSTTSKGESLKILVTKIAIKHKHGTIIRLRWQSCLETMNYRNLSLKNEFSSIDWNHFLSTFSLALTYLVISIQFELASKIT